MMSIRFEGGKELAEKLRSLPNRTSRRVVRDALIEGAEPIRSVAASIAPRAPGAPDMADHIVVSNARPADGSVGIAVGPAKRFFYAKFQEFGTVHHGAQAFMRPAFDGQVRKSLGIIKSALWAALIRRGLAGGRGSSSGGGLD